MADQQGQLPEQAPEQPQEQPPAQPPEEPEPNILQECADTIEQVITLYVQLEENLHYPKMRQSLRRQDVQDVLVAEEPQVPPQTDHLHDQLNENVADIVRHFVMLEGLWEEPGNLLANMETHIARMERKGQLFVRMAPFHEDMFDALSKAREMAQIMADGQLLDNCHWAKALLYMLIYETLPEADQQHRQHCLTAAGQCIQQTIQVTGSAPGWWEFGENQVWVAPPIPPDEPPDPVQTAWHLINQVNAFKDQLENNQDYLDLRTAVRHRQFDQYLHQAHDGPMPEWAVHIVHLSNQLGDQLYDGIANLNNHLVGLMARFVRGGAHAQQLQPIRDTFEQAFWKLKEMYRILREARILVNAL